MVLTPVRFAAVALPVAIAAFLLIQRCATVLPPNTTAPVPLPSPAFDDLFDIQKASDDIQGDNYSDVQRAIIVYRRSFNDISPDNLNNFIKFVKNPLFDDNKLRNLYLIAARAGGTRIEHGVIDYMRAIDLKTCDVNEPMRVLWILMSISSDYNRVLSHCMDLPEVMQRECIQEQSLSIGADHFISTESATSN